MTSLLMKPTSVGKDTQHELDQTLKKLACVSNQWGPLLSLAKITQNFPTLSQYGAECVRHNWLKNVSKHC